MNSLCGENRDSVATPRLHKRHVCQNDSLAPAFPQFPIYSGTSFGLQRAARGTPTYAYANYVVDRDIQDVSIANFSKSFSTISERFESSSFISQVAEIKRPVSQCSSLACRLSQTHTAPHKSTSSTRSATNQRASPQLQSNGMLVILSQGMNSSGVLPAAIGVNTAPGWTATDNSPCSPNCSPKYSTSRV